MVFDPQPDWRVAIYAVALTTMTGLAFGLVPALQSTRRDLGVDFRDVTATDRRGSRRLQNTLVTLQVAVCLVLLLSAGLLARGLASRADARSRHQHGPRHRRRVTTCRTRVTRRRPRRRSSGR